MIEYLDAVERDSLALGSSARAAGPDASVPSCPGWTVTGLIRHIGRVHGWCEAIVRTRAKESIRFRDLAAPPDDPDELLSWYERGAATLAATLRAADPAEDVWTWHPNGGGVAFWRRRMALETAIHRWDAERVSSESPEPIDAELAADGVDEMLDLFAPMHPDLAKVAGDGSASIHLHCNDAPGEWLIELGADGVPYRLTREHSKGDAAVRGPASDLFLFAWARIPPSSVEIFGDTELVDRWHQTMRF